MSASSRDRAAETYPRVVLGLLIAVYILNFIDRHIFSVLAESIKADLQISDAQLGFLGGAAFSVFYAVMGLPLARVADLGNRKNLITAGLGFWSLMTALSGLARGFFPLALCRFGVGVGEASASPAAYSLLYDLFPPKIRTTVLGIYSSGIYIGQGIGIFLGGSILAAWSRTWPDPSDAPFGLHGWQAAFMAVGLPGLFLAGLVFLVREPTRGGLDGVTSAAPARPIAEGLALLGAMLPPSSLLAAWRGGPRALGLNLAVGLGVAALALMLVRLTGDLIQWAAVGAGVYALFCWTQAMALRDPACARLILTSRTLLAVIGATAAANFAINSFVFWAAPFYQRRFGLDPGTLGLMLGLASAGMGLLGVAAGGLAADRLRLTWRPGKAFVIFVCLIALAACGALMLLAPTFAGSYAGFMGFIFFAAAPAGPAVSSINDLVLPRMRATASAFGFTVIYLVAGAIGPYTVGKISDLFADRLGGGAEGLRLALGGSLISTVVGAVLALAAMRWISADEPRLAERARAMGEPLQGAI